METPIKDYYNRIIGWVDVQPNGDKTVKDYGRRILGYYDATYDVTQDFSRRIIAHGDVATGLIWAEYEKTQKGGAR